MSEESNNPSFRIRPLSRKPPPPPPEVTLEPTSEWPRTGARFKSSQAALAFIGAVAGAGLADEARARRGPDGQWWAEVGVSWRQAAGLADNAGGQAYAGRDGLWVAVPADGSAPAAVPSQKPPKSGELLLWRNQQSERLAAPEWQEVGLRELIGQARLKTAAPADLHEAVIIAPGVLGRDILRRACIFGCTVALSPALRRPLLGAGEANAAVFLRVSRSGRPIPRSFLQSLLRLPATAVARPIASELGDEAGHGQLLVDVRHRAPLSGALLSALAPPGECWFLGGPDLGHWQLEIAGDAVDGADFLALPLPASPPPEWLCADNPDALPAPIALKLVARRTAPGLPDAVLVDDKELGWLQTYLIGRAVARTAFLALGPGRHLLIAPGGLLSTVPFGVPLRRAGSDGFYLQQNCDFYPPLPEVARQRAFPRREGEALALCRQPGGGIEALRYDLTRLVPVWTLWLGEIPEAVAGLSGAEAQRLQNLSASIRQAREAAKPVSKIGKIHKASGKITANRETLLQQALLAEQRGQLARAAELLEQAGEFAAAGRLYEQAAGE